nr:norsolorinic acid reductase a [Quercus suber]
MCEAEGMGLAPWGALGRGMFKLPEEFNAADREGRQGGVQSEKYIRVTEKLIELAKKKDTLITSIALAYVTHKAPYVFPIVGGRKVEHLKGNVEALAVELTQDEIDEIEDAAPFDIGFPMSMLFGYGGATYRSRMTSEDVPLVTTNTRLVSVGHKKPIHPKQGEQHKEVQNMK